MTDLPATLVELADRFGVATEYEDWTGSRRTVAEATIVAVLDAFGVSARTDDDRRKALADCDRRYWSGALPPVVVARAGATTTFWVHVTHGAPAELTLLLEDGTVRTGLRQLENNTPPFSLGDRLVGEASFELPADLPAGYHRLRLTSSPDAEPAETLVIVSPATLTPPARCWGPAVQLYSVASERSWGIGDLTDLTDLAVWSSVRHGAGFILVNPLHAAAPSTPMEPSPYLPTSRRFVNPIYLRVEAIPEFACLRGRGRLRKARARLHRRAVAAELIDRDAVWQVKRAALEEVYRVPRSAGRELAYQAFRRRHGRALDDFATWCALAEEFGGDWRRWPVDLRHPDSPAVAGYAASHAERVDFHRWLQWQADDQLAAAQTTACTVGMTVGVIHDLAVGVDPGGADAWALQDVLAAGVSAGAPPDEFNQLGQDWSQPPWRPDRLAERAYEPFRALVGGLLRHAGGVRIDHIIGLFRLWWIPPGAAPTEGTYVRYDHEALIGIVALEAHRAGAVVIGEDLGTVEPWVRDYLAERQVLGTSILWFEFDRADGSGTPRPLPAEHWREFCLSAVTTHDLPPTPGYLAGAHVRLRDRLGLLTRAVDEELAADRRQQRAWFDELRRAGVLSGDPDGADTDELVRALHRYLVRSPSRLLALSLADAVGDVNTQNQPGTTDEYPNWRVPLRGPDGARLLLEDVFDDPRAATLAGIMAAGVGHTRGAAGTA
ncbi:4-alpha-glucanotransferase [Mycolicibacterium hassiacum DSM 44199]|jgi:4-alpha-glucanotransferase|uniref:4-alpha-glucanotransferase n=1 Tax=Mycolicibacterium hassiacum (strain DSM 44199 / CIP 105218 / JCM 12690 / 3849) TaxID=1122247 RepID=K5BCH6_MYCHD|nr:4-alpha-glucanotransferase [Mycolicibacterium hassiacum]EKF21557.1 4-alpha-glucanotransferase [Mycolicibacterium hassiacum DSM 44199]MBX5485862.1 4-alpha-glucanotransferase [Mycolicibacterium hassiacum]MDA4088543.1 4-alpha-glucanotransferase [Mycolicibacterium hassiacum DSM 44199]VCT90084.1 4-alpha-glucanotransferase [Mycolicibacterium hassiacum DSM 44199]